MMTLPKINIDQYDYLLPNTKIAKYPLEKRDASKLLVYRGGEIKERKFSDISELIPDNSALVFNNSKVICARLLFKKETGANIEIFCLEPHFPVEYQQNLENTKSVSWKCLVGNKKKWKTGSLKLNIHIKGKEIQLHAKQDINDSNNTIINFKWEETSVSFGEILDEAGKIPIPPYLLRDAEQSDHERYQTVYSKIKGSVAAPTAGLHFTPEVISNLENKNVFLKEFTLHVGAGTFKPVQAECISDHDMHEETFSLNMDQLLFLRKNLGCIYAVGTTSTRTLESIYQIGVKCLKNTTDNIFKVNQWDPYENGFEIKAENALDALIEYFQENNLIETVVKTSIIIVPGYQFKIVNALITNFHQPRSTLLLLIAALIGDEWKRVYDFALENEFRFLSYGDSSILFPSK